MIRVAINGAMGRMGLAIAGEIQKNKSTAGMVLAGAVERSGHSSAGTSYQGNPSLVLHNLENFPFQDMDVWIDFSIPESTLALAEKASEQKKPVVIGTTGFTEAQKEKILEISRKIPILLSSNMSIGVNLLFGLTRYASERLKGKGFDAEIMEIHHRHKKDAPSGTSRTLESIIDGVFQLGKENIIHGRSGIIGERPDNQMGSMAMRGGDVVGEHTVYFLGEGERIELKHSATSRGIFAGGALVAAEFLHGKTPGLYSMMDALGLH